MVTVKKWGLRNQKDKEDHDKNNYARKIMTMVKIFWEKIKNST